MALPFLASLFECFTFIWLRRLNVPCLNAYGVSNCLTSLRAAPFKVSVASPFPAALFECFTFQWLTPFMKIQL